MDEQFLVSRGPFWLLVHFLVVWAVWWYPNGRLHRPVLSVSSYLSDREHGADEELLASLSNASSSIDRSLFVEKRHRYGGGANDTRELAGAATGAGNGRRGSPELEDALVSALGSVVQELLAAFHAAQVQVRVSSGVLQYYCA